MSLSYAQHASFRCNIFNWQLLVTKLHVKSYNSQMISDQNIMLKIKQDCFKISVIFFFTILSECGVRPVYTFYKRLFTRVIWHFCMINWHYFDWKPVCLG